MSYSSCTRLRGRSTITTSTIVPYKLDVQILDYYSTPLFHDIINYLFTHFDIVNSIIIIDIIDIDK